MLTHSSAEDTIRERKRLTSAQIIILGFSGVTLLGVLRKKLEADPDSPQYIQTHIGVGYRMMKVAYRIERRDFQCFVHVSRLLSAWQIAQSAGKSYIFFMPSALELILSITARMPSQTDRSANTSTTLPWSVNGDS